MVLILLGICKMVRHLEHADNDRVFFEVNIRYQPAIAAQHSVFLAVNFSADKTNQLPGRMLSVPGYGQVAAFDDLKHLPVVVTANSDQAKEYNYNPIHDHILG